MATWRNIAPFLGAILLAICNVDWVIIPALRPFFVSLWDLCSVVAVIATVELVLWYKFWRWFFLRWLPHRQGVEETIEFTKELGHELKRKGYVDRIVGHFERTFVWAANPDGRLFKVIKAWGHIGMIFLGFEPFVVGGRLVGVVFCATTGWRAGLYTLAIGNIFHVFLSVGSWELIFYGGRFIMNLIYPTT